MKMKKLNEFNFSKHVDALLDSIKEHWHIRALPKGYKEFCKDYRDFQGMEELNQEELMDSFKGTDNGTACSFAFPISTSLSHVAYDDICQGRKPLRTLIGAIFAYGIEYGQRYEAIGDNTSTYYRLHSIKHCIFMIEHEKNEEKRELYRQELKDYFNVKIDHLVTHTKYSMLQDKINKKVVKPLIISYFKSLKNKSAIIVKTNRPRLNKIWEILFNLNFGRIINEHPVFKELKKELKEEGISISKKKTKTHEHIYLLKSFKRKVIKK